MINSGATHIFVHSKYSFRNYNEMKHENVQCASGNARIVGPGKFYIRNHAGIYVEAFHVLQFRGNSTSVHKIANFFHIKFGENEIGEIICSFFKRGTKEVVFETNANAFL